MIRPLPFVDVELPFSHKVRRYLLSRDLRPLAKHNLRDLTGFLLNVPLLQMTINEKFVKIVVPGKVISSGWTIKLQTMRTRGQMIKWNNIDFDDECQLKYMQHDYNWVNKRVIKLAWEDWRKEETIERKK